MVDQTKVSFSYKPDLKRELKFDLVISLLFFFLGLLVGIIPALLLAVGLFISTNLFREIFSEFNGYEMNSQTITITKTRWITNKKVVINYDNLTGITYLCNNGLGGSHIIYETKNGEYKSYVPGGIFKFAYVMKYLNETKGIPVKVQGNKDDEIELFLSGRIESIPLQNVKHES